jgi:hypothetical protein
LKFEVFERLNTGSVSLNNQELRNCIYHGPYIDLLRELSKEDDFRYLLGLNDQEKRMGDIELVARFAAFYHVTYMKYKPPMKDFIDNDNEQDSIRSAPARERCLCHPYAMEHFG